MSKEVDANFLKIQTCVLKVNIHCGGCKQKVKKILHKIDGVYTTTIDAEQGRVTVSGNVDPEALIKKLVKAGKHAELLVPKGSNGINNNKNNNNHQQQQQFQKPQPINTKIHQQKDNGKPQKGGPGGGKDLKGQQPLPSLQQQQQLQQLQQMKGFKDLKLPQLKDMKLPFQDPKTVKFSLPPEDFDDDGSDYDDEFDDDYDDEDFDDMDCFDADFDEDFKNMKIKNMNAPPNGHGKMADQKGVGGANAKKGGLGANLPPQNKGMGGANEAKNGKAGAKKGAGGAGGGNQGQGGGKNGGGPMDIKNGNKPAPNGHGEMNIQGHGQNHNMNNINVANGANKGGVKSSGHPMMMNPNMMMGQGMQSMNVGQMGSNMQAQMGNIHQGAVQGLPAGAVPPGYFQARMAAPPPEMMAAANPYQQQQYMAAMLQQQQLQQRMMMMNGQDPALQQQMMMAYPRPPYPAMPPPQMAYIPQMPPQGEPYTNFFSDENTSSCSIM